MSTSEGNEFVEKMIKLAFQQPNLEQAFNFTLEQAQKVKFKYPEILDSLVRDKIYNRLDNHFSNFTSSFILKKYDSVEEL